MTHATRQRTMLAGVLVLVFDAALFGVARGSAYQPAPPFPSQLVVPVLLAAPGLLALVAAATGRRTVAIAAGILCFPQSLLSFSGVTLVFLIPALAILRSAGADHAHPAPSSPIRPGRVLVLLIAAIPIVAVAVITLGLFAAVLFVLIAGLAGLARGSGRAGSARRRTSGLREGATGAAIVVLVVGAWVAILGLTETVCSVARLGPTGELIWERVPVTDELTVGDGTVGESCSSGQPRPEALVLAAGLLGAAFLRAALPLERRPVATVEAV